ncbi:MAG: methylated-DNA--[protein]-cysteine S-methyltransferase [Candidatus Dormibacteraeota bacterium]|nr:methylated-DNA--[protein]-cysteine S-methyltransferase [Candidatus Dormibacteraeota bacterium]
MMLDVLERDLRELGRTRAPRRFAGRVLAAVGLVDSYAQVDTPIGPYFLAWNQGGVSAVREASIGADRFESWFAQEVGRPLARVESVPERLRRAAEDRGPRARLRYDLRGLTDFERSVLLKTLEIPRGEVRTYAWVAREIGHPRAVRAVGTALRKNPLPILIPCHRVIRADGLGNYAGGAPERKRAMLSYEGAEPDRVEELLRRSVHFTGSRTTGIFCVPTCRNVRRTRQEHLVSFRNEREAREAGFRPCQVCRPAALAS